MMVVKMVWRMVVTMAVQKVMRLVETKGLQMVVLMALLLVDLRVDKKVE
jgi:hypothetical protein